MQAVTPKTLADQSTQIVQTRIAASFLVAGSLIFLVSEFVAAAAWTDPPYSYTYHYISDLGVRGPLVLLGKSMNSPLSWVMNIGFFLFGIAYLIGVMMLKGLRSWRRGGAFALAFSIAVGGMLLALNPGTGAPPAGNVYYHGLGALASILGGNLLLILLGCLHQAVDIAKKPGCAIVVLGIFGLVSFVAFLALAGSGANILMGLIERLAVYPITIGFIVAGVSIWTQHNTGSCA